MSDDFSAVQIGDELLCHSGYGSQQVLARVDRVTPTQIVIGHSRYRRADGYRIGDTGYGRGRVTVPTEKDRERLTRYEVCKAIRQTTTKSTKHLSAERLTAIAQELRA